MQVVTNVQGFPNPSMLLSVLLCVLLCIISNRPVAAEANEAGEANVSGTDRRSAFNTLMGALQKIRDRQSYVPSAYTDYNNLSNYLRRVYSDLQLSDEMKPSKRGYPTDMRRSFFNPLGYAPASARLHPGTGGGHSGGSSKNSNLFRYGK